MSIPEHYSRDIAQRCRYLIENLWPTIAELKSAQFGGPLQTTFLLAMATPMIILPFDRIFIPGNGGNRVGDDTELNPDLADLVKNTLADGQRFGAAPFGAQGSWCYVPDIEPFNVADGLPGDLIGRLGAPDAVKEAEETPTRQILKDLRNALAHGGVVYLDNEGRNSDDQTAIFAFVAKKSANSDNFNVVRVHEDDFRKFLTAWADWLGKTTGLEGGLDAEAA